MNQKYSNIQLLRFLAAIGVVAFHQAGAYVASHQLSELNHFTWGAKGVALFFVISGFVIFTSYTRRPVPAKVFAINRFARIVPSYWALTFLALVLGLFVKVGGTPATSPDQVWVWRVSSFAFASQPLGFSSPILYQGWSLEYEMFFYGVFTVLVALKQRGYWLAILTSGIVTLALLIPGFSIDALGFVLGGIVAEISHGIPKSRRSFDSRIGLLVVMGLVACLSLASWNTELIWLLGFSGVVYLAVRIPNASTTAVMWLGSASYPIYLLQWFTVPVLTRVSVSLFPTGSWTGQLVTIFAAVIVTTAVGLVWDRLIDQNLTKWTKAILAGVKPKSV